MYDIIGAIQTPTQGLLLAHHRHIRVSGRNVPNCPGQRSIDTSEMWMRLYLFPGTRTGQKRDEAGGANMVDVAAMDFSPLDERYPTY